MDSTEVKLAGVLSRMERHRLTTRGLLVNRIGRRGAALLFFGLLDLVYGYSLIWPGVSDLSLLSPNLKFLASLAPLMMWGVLWIIPGILAVVCAFLKEDRWGFTGVIAVKMMWGVIYLAAAVTGQVDRAYVSATLWLCVAGFVAVISTWPEPPPQLQTIMFPDRPSPPVDPPEE